ncbi:hypothetical protein O7635_29440 [Asanoa sp. WMMD1127]|uniref:hypothetical protein n=1 Tax=Asanoa sp. WMMD1127 TaxID=3016107 RepID=UPI0024180064|nr:hypothetical protein [Asanoa sp. WMMD1127]MDG4825993.1 hypothetical protein [Asanoa sp. WMMD1127]
MPKAVTTIVANDPKKGLTAGEIRTALRFVKPESTVKVQPGFGGQIKALTVVEDHG